MKNKVFIILPTLGLGGGEKLAVDIANNLDICRFDVSLISFYKPNDSINLNRVDKNRVKVITFNKKKGLDICHFIKMFQFLTKEKPDVVHSHLNVLLYLMIPFMIMKNSIKVHTIHSIADKESPGFNKLISYICFKYLNVLPVGISDSIHESIVSYYGLEKQNVPIIYNGVNHNKIIIKKNSIMSKESFIFVTVGTLYEVKNHIFMIKCFEKVLENTGNVKLTIVGDGELRKQLQCYIDENDLNNYVELYGRTDNVFKVLSECDCFLMTSIYEGLPLSIIEALMSSLPVIAVNVGGVPDLVTDGFNGVLIRNHSIEDFSNAMIKMIKNQEFYNLCKSNTTSIISKCSLKQCVESYELLFSQQGERYFK